MNINLSNNLYLAMDIIPDIIASAHPGFFANDVPDITLDIIVDIAPDIIPYLLFNIHTLFLREGSSFER
jgi:hypothetical protein